MFARVCELFETPRTHNRQWTDGMSYDGSMAPVYKLFETLSFGHTFYAGVFSCVRTALTRTVCDAPSHLPPTVRDGAEEIAF